MNNEQVTPKIETSYYKTLAHKELKAYIGEGLKSDGPNLNVLNILRTFIEDEDSILYIPSTYKRGSAKKVDEKVHQGQRSAPTAVKVNEFVSHLTRFNFSVRGLKDVQVEQEDGSLKPQKVFRTFNIIRDGSLVIPKLEAELSQSTYDMLVPAGIVYDQVGRQVSEEQTRYQDYVYTIDLTDIPVVSSQWAKPNQIKIYDLMQLEKYISERIKGLNKLAKEYGGTGATTTGEDLYRERPTKSVEPSETYEVECIEYKLKTKAPKVENLSEAYTTLESIKDQISADRSYKDYLRFIIRAVIFAIESSAKKGSYNWSEEKPLPRSKSKVYKETTVTDSNGTSLILQRITWKDKVAR